MKHKVKCSCGRGHKITCANCSKIKMVILLKKGNTALKYRQRGNRYVNPVWYNHLSKNGKAVPILIKGMYNRFEKSIYKEVANKVLFYDNHSKELITSK